jgi:type IV fimbrial biogenesis protein FimT
MRYALLEMSRRSAGFTLVELLVTIVVLSILLGLAVPAFRTFMQNDQQWVQQNNLVLALNAARSEAIKNDTIISAQIPGGAQICTSSDRLTCTGTPWEQGWIVRGLDPANPQNPAGKRLQVVGALPTGTTLSAADGNLTVTFLPDGTINKGALVNPAAPFVWFKMCDSRGAAHARYLQVGLMGRVVASPTVGQDLAGNALACP